MKKYMIFLFMMILFVSLTAVAAENTTDNTYTQTSIATPQTTTTTDSIQTTHNTNNNEISATTTDTDSSEETATEVQTSNKTHKQATNTIQKTQNTNIKTASASEELQRLESSTKTNLLNAFEQAKIEIDNANSTYEKEQIPLSIIPIANRIISDAEEAEIIYADSGDESLTDIINNIRNNAEYARLLIHPEDLWNVELAHQYRPDPWNSYRNELGEQQIFTLWGQKKNETTILTLDVTSLGWSGLYNDYNEIHHNNEGFDQNNQVFTVSIGYFIGVMGNASEFTQIPYPIVRAYLESMYNQGFNYTRVYGGYVWDDGIPHINGTTLKYSTSSIVFWKMKKGSNDDEYFLTNERYYPDSTTGHPPDNMPRASTNDEDGFYFVGYVIKNEVGGIHVDGVLIEYRAEEEEETINITVNKKWNDNNNQDGIRPSTVTVQLLADGEKYGDNIVLYSDNDWSYHYINLPKYNAHNEEIVYVIDEISVPTGYTVSYDNYTVVNTHIPETVEIEAIKEWDDEYNQDGIRPENVTVNLLRNGVRINSATLSENTNWRARFTNLAKYQNGNLLTYTVTEDNIDSRYTSSVRRVDNEFIFTNSYTPLTTNVTVKKVWDDEDNHDGLRPSSVRFQLLEDNTPLGSPITLNERNNWEYTFTDLPVNSNGHKINYQVIETSVPAGYTAVNNGLTITNTHIPETTELEVFKEWDDDHNRDGLRPDSVTVDLLADGEVVEEVVLNHDTEWRYKFHELPVYKNGNQITYTISEKTVDNYTTTITKTNGEYIIVNKYDPLVKSLDVIKVWDDHDNEHELRPDSIQVQLFADGEKYGEYVTVSAANNWKYTYTNLPVNFDGKPVTYFVEEVGVPENYVKTIDVTSDNEITITNIFDPEHTQVDVIKEWDDNHNSDGLRPSSVQVQLYANGAKQGEPVTLSQDNYWRYSFTNLLKYIDDVEVEYTVEETTNTPGYTSTLLTIMKNEFAIINTHEPEKVNITINKIWNDNNNQDGLRPENVRVELLADGEKYDTIVLNQNNGWTYTFTNLNKNFDGKEIEYSLDEIGVADGYTASHDGYTIINTHVSETTEIHVVKEWVDNDDQDGLRPESITVTLKANDNDIQTIVLNSANNWTQVINNLPAYENGKLIEYTVTETPIANYTNTIEYNNEKIIIKNIHEPETINITINKIWADDNDRDGLRPDSVPVTILKDGEAYINTTLTIKNNWTTTINNLPKYADGREVKYVVDEVGTPEGYTSRTVGYTITNTHVPETVEVVVIVEWDDLDDIDEIRPENVTIILYKNDEPIENVTVSPDEDWRNIFDELPEYENGTKINYTADEILPDGYTRTIEINDNEIIITNIHRPQLVNITINKVWDDDSNRDGIRPDNVRVQLLSDGKVYTTVTLDDMNNWKYSFLNLPKTRKGIEIEYTLNEVNNIAGYTSNVEGYTVTNIHEPETVDVKVNVEWDDLNDTDEIRPENVTIIIYKNDEPIENVTITPDDDWKTIFEDLPKYENGTVINYTADEILPNGYNKTIDLGDNEINITNIHRPTTEVNVDIVWDDLDDVDGIRPDNVTVILYADGKPVDNVTVTNKTWKTVFEDLPKYDDDGKLINYTVDEVLPNGYTKTIESDGNNFTITNIHRPTIDINVDIVWDDLDDVDGIRPDNVTIILYADGKPVDNVTVTNKTWKTVFEDLPQYDENGNPIKYTVDEVLPNGYTKTIESDGNNFTITNIHRPTIDINVDIVWDDLDDEDGIRPDNVTIILYADGKVVRNVTVTKDTWKTVFENLPQYDENGNPIKYTIDEVLPNGYTKTIESDGNNFVVTNVHRPGKNITVQVKWDDLEDIDGIRPDSVTIRLYANGEVVREVTVTPEDDWNVVFENLPQYDENGNPIIYTIDEVLPNGYTKTIESDGDNFIITNIHRPQLVWTWKLVEILSDDNQDNPGNIREPANNQPAKIVNKKVSSYNNWKINNRYSKYYRYNKYNKYNRYNRAYRNHNRHYTHHGLTRHAYRLYIQLYNEYLAGNISFEDFIVLLEKEGVNTQVLNFNEDGTITIDYDNIEDVPDKITVEYKNDDIPSTSDTIDTSNPDNNEAPVIDSGRVEVKSEPKDVSSNVDVEE